jgi:hypothetical protein
MFQNLFKKLKTSGCLEKMKAGTLLLLLFFSIGSTFGQSATSVDKSGLKTTDEKFHLEKQMGNKEEWEAQKMQTQPISAKITIMRTAFDKLSPREQALIEANPSLYKIADLKNAPSGKGAVSQKMLETMSPEKADYVRANPDLFEIID